MSSTGRSVLNLSSDSSLSRMSNRMSDKMSTEMTKLKSMSASDIFLNGFLLLVGIGVLVYIGMSIYKEQKNPTVQSTNDNTGFAEDRLTSNDYAQGSTMRNPNDDMLYQV